LTLELDECGLYDMALMRLQQAEKVLANHRVLITGHTGFTGTWAQIWLEAIGAECHGISFENLDELSMRRLTRVSPKSEFLGDIADTSFVYQAFEQIRPHFVLHLAAQPIVSVSYEYPLRTITSNSQGTAVVLDACLKTSSVQSVVCVTTDKVYRNAVAGRKHRESDELGGSDPYSASKSAAEHVVQAYKEIFEYENRKLSLQVARGGNIVGGGDYSQDRIVPDLVKSIINRKPILIRQLESTRPWQHVMSLVHAYVLLLARHEEANSVPFDVWNFGPTIDHQFRVSDILRIFEKEWRLPPVLIGVGDFKESHDLKIDSTKAMNALGWQPKWSNEEVFGQTIDWYRQVHEGNADALSITKLQLSKYREMHA
jgi:CDP-glucose 4,6-dehydratase